MNGLLTERQCAKRLQGSSQQVTLSGGNSSALQMLPAIPLIDARHDPWPRLIQPRCARFGTRFSDHSDRSPCRHYPWPIGLRAAGSHAARLRISPNSMPSRRTPAQRGPTPSISLTSMVARPWLVPMRQVFRRRCAVPLIGRSAVSAAPSSWRTAVDRPASSST